jgi:hypothetical protein
VVEKGKGKALQHGKGAIGHLEEFFEAGPLPLKCDIAHAIRVMFKYGPHAPKSTACDVGWEEDITSITGSFFFPVTCAAYAAIIKENWQRARQDGLDMARFFRSHGNA